MSIHRVLFYISFVLGALPTVNLWYRFTFEIRPQVRRGLQDLETNEIVFLVLAVESYKDLLWYCAATAIVMALVTTAIEIQGRVNEFWGSILVGVTCGTSLMAVLHCWNLFTLHASLVNVVQIILVVVSTVLAVRLQKTLPI